MGNVTLKPPRHIPGFMRPTSSSEARRKSSSSVTKSPGLTTTATPDKSRARQNGQIPPMKNFSLPSASMLRKEMVQEGTTPVASPKYSFKQSEDQSEQHSGQELGHSKQQSEQQSGQNSGQSERPKLTKDSNLTFEELLRTVTPEEELGKVSGEPVGVEESEEAETAETAPEPIFVPNSQQITSAQPSAYWAGRMTVLSDRFRNEALESSSSSANGSDMHDDSRRMRRVFIHLRGLCANQQAIDSLETFQQLWAMREYGGNVVAREVSGSSTDGKKVKEKRGVFEKLTGRKK
ncbi:hypothetical protein MMC07_005356 [Pseudocyphellaria aurata]|nr:hypothetical protein [Pseudocyphellaria aurata]